MKYDPFKILKFTFDSDGMLSSCLVPNPEQRLETQGHGDITKVNCKRCKARAQKK